MFSLWRTLHRWLLALMLQAMPPRQQKRRQRRLCKHGGVARLPGRPYKPSPSRRPQRHGCRRCTVAMPYAGAQRSVSVVGSGGVVWCLQQSQPLQSLLRSMLFLCNEPCRCASRVCMWSVCSGCASASLRVSTTARMDAAARKQSGNRLCVVHRRTCKPSSPRPQHWGSNMYEMTVWAAGSPQPHCAHRLFAVVL